VYLRRQPPFPAFFTKEINQLTNETCDYFFDDDNDDLLTIIIIVIDDADATYARTWQRRHQLMRTHRDDRQQ
jgi:hypothetical protein